MLKGISSLARRRHEFSARRNLTGTVVLESIVLAVKLGRKRAGEKQKPKRALTNAMRADFLSAVTRPQTPRNSLKRQLTTMKTL